MGRTRTDEILEGWKMVAHDARRPTAAPRPRPGRFSLAMGLVATAAVVAVLVIALSVRGLGPDAQRLPGVRTSPSPTVSPSPTPSPTTTATATPSGSPAATPADGSPTPAEVTAARAAVDAYTADLVRGDYAAAWALLGPEDQAQAGPFAAWSSERRAFFQSVAGRYTIVVSPSTVGPITDWLAGTNGAPIDLAHAVLIEVDYPSVGGNAGYELFIADATPAGVKLYSVR